MTRNCFAGSSGSARGAECERAAAHQAGRRPRGRCPVAAGRQRGRSGEAARGAEASAGVAGVSIASCPATYTWGHFMASSLIVSRFVCHVVWATSLYVGLCAQAAWPCRPHMIRTTSTHMATGNDMDHAVDLVEFLACRSAWYLARWSWQTMAGGLASRYWTCSSLSGDGRRSRHDWAAFRQCQPHAALAIHYPRCSSRVIFVGHVLTYLWTNKPMAPARRDLT